MAKKYFVAPYLKVVRVHNDIIATSVYDEKAGAQLVGERSDDFDD